MSVRPTPMRDMVADLLSMHVTLLIEAIAHEGADIATGDARHAVTLWESIRDGDAGVIGRCFCGVVDHHLILGECRECRAKRRAQGELHPSRVRAANATCTRNAGKAEGVGTGNVPPPGGGL